MANGEKAELRRKMRRRLRSVSAEKAEQDAAALTERVLALPDLQAASGVFLCLSFEVEIDTWGLAERLAAAGKRTFVPRVVLGGHPPGKRAMHVHPYPCRLDELPIGLRQPAADQPALAESAIEETIDVALILGLAFDRHGVRLGHGGGFFDRFLGRHPLTTIGLAYDEQIVEELPREPHDVPMGRVATPSRTIRPERGHSTS